MVTITGLVQLDTVLKLPWLSKVDAGESIWVLSVGFKLHTSVDGEADQSSSWEFKAQGDHWMDVGCSSSGQQDLRGSWRRKLRKNLLAHLELEMIL